MNYLQRKLIYCLGLINLSLNNVLTAFENDLFSFAWYCSTASNKSGSNFIAFNLLFINTKLYHYILIIQNFVTLFSKKKRTP